MLGPLCGAAEQVEPGGPCLADDGADLGGIVPQELVQEAERLPADSGGFRISSTIPGRRRDSVMPPSTVGLENQLRVRVGGVHDPDEATASGEWDLALGDGKPACGQDIRQ